MYLQARGFLWRLIVPVRWPDETSVENRHCSITGKQPLVVHERQQPNYFACQLLMDMQCHNQIVFVKWKLLHLAQRRNTIFLFLFRAKLLGFFFFLGYFNASFFQCPAVFNLTLASHTGLFYCPVALNSIPFAFGSLISNLFLAYLTDFLPEEYRPGMAWQAKPILATDVVLN